MKHRLTLILIPLLLSGLACSFSIGSTPTPDTAATQAVAAQTEAAAQQEQTAQAEQAAAYQSTLDAAATITAATKEALALQSTQQAQEEEAALAQTAVVADMYNRIETLYGNGDISGTQGDYYQLEDFDKSIAKIGWLTWWNSGYTPENFVIHTSATWETASNISDWWQTGCGFVFRASDNKNFYFIYLALDGNVYLKGYVDDVYRELGKAYYGPVDHPSGNADLMLAVDGNKISFYVNDKPVLQKTNDALLSSGDLAMTVFSGTNKDFGTRCQLTNIELWELP